MPVISRLGLLKSHIFSTNNRKIDKMMKHLTAPMRAYDKKTHENCKLGFLPQGKKARNFEIQGADWIKSCSLVWKAESVRKQRERLRDTHKI